MNKIALITGATEGIGKAIALKLAQEKYDVIITGRRYERLMKLEKDIKSNYQVNALSISFDVRNRDEVKNWGLETWNLAKKIFPILLIGVFIVGLIGGIAAFFIPGADPVNAVGVAVSPYIGGKRKMIMASPA